MKRLLILFCLLLLLPCAASGASAQPLLWVSEDGTHGIRAIDWYKEGQFYYLFLPGNTAPDQLKIGFSGAETITIGDTLVQNGDPADLPEIGETCTVTMGNKKYEMKVMQGSADLPALYITTESGSLDYFHKSKKNEEPGQLVFVTGDGTVEYDGSLTGIKIRGNSSVQFVKKNYTLKLENGTDLCGMGKSRTWILTGNYRDKSLLRNQITYDLAMYAGLAYTPEHISAEVYINNQYEGLYLFSEKVAIGESRIDISDLKSATEDLNNGDVSGFPVIGSKSAKKGKYKAYDIPAEPEDVTGGYLLEYEAYSSRYGQEASSYYTKRGNTVVVKSPKYCTEDQMKYITGFVQSFENAIFSEDGTDPDTGKHYTELMDLDSLVRKYMLEEISKNYDGNNSSQYFYKPADSQSTLAFAGPAWDYDSAYGSYAQEHNRNNLLRGKGLWVATASGGDYWWPALYKQPDFYEKVCETYWNTYRRGLLILLGREDGAGTPLMSLDQYAEQIADSAAMNVLRWPRQKNPNTVAQTGYTFEENIEYLRTFISDRLDYLDTEWCQ